MRGECADRGVAFFTDGLCAAFGERTWETLQRRCAEGTARVVVEPAEAMDSSWFQKPATGPCRRMRMPFAALTTAFDIAWRMPGAVDPDSERSLGVGAKPIYRNASVAPSAAQAAPGIQRRSYS